MDKNKRLFERSSSEAHKQWLRENFLTQLRDIVEGKGDVTHFANQLANQIDKLEQDRIRDPLTGAFNRGFIGAVLGQELALSAKSDQRLGLAMLDLDHFKSINDQEPDGHAAGDRALIEAVKILKEIVGTHSLIGRWGGEEFVVVTPQITPEAFLEMVEDIGNTISGWLAKNAQLVRPQVTTSIGAVMADGSELPVAIMEKADKLLYAAKESGRNQLHWQAGTTIEVVKFS